MCDTQVIRHQGSTLFAKNSDREPDEPQHIRYYPAVWGDRDRTVKTTYVEVGQVPDRHAVILSQPAWLWGAEMGVNTVGNFTVWDYGTDKRRRFVCTEAPIESKLPSEDKVKL